MGLRKRGVTVRNEGAGTRRSIVAYSLRKLGEDFDGKHDGAVAQFVVVEQLARSKTMRTITIYEHGARHPTKIGAGD